MSGDWCFEHPWMTFFIVLAGIEAMRIVGVATMRAIGRVASDGGK